MERMVISMVVEGNEKQLRELPHDLLKMFDGIIKNVTFSKVEEQKKEIEVPRFMCCNDNFTNMRDS